jgi:signal transduction histidine kinase
VNQVLSDDEGEPAGEAGDHEILKGISQALAQDKDLNGALASTVEWVQRSVGPTSHDVRVLLPDRSGRLRVAAARGDGADVGRLRTARHRTSFEEGRPILLDLPRQQGKRVLMLPLSAGGRVVGVLEVTAEAVAIDRSRPALDAIVRQAAVAIHGLVTADRLERERRAFAGAMAVAGDMARPGSSRAAVRAAARLCHEAFGTPVGAWLSTDDGDSMTLIDVRGMGARKRSGLRDGLHRLPVWDGLSELERNWIVSRYQTVVGARQVAVVEAGPALLLVAGTAADAPPLAMLRAVLPEALARRGARERERSVDEMLDLGVAWAAHEFRSPLIGATAAIERFLMSDDPNDLDRELLRRSGTELRHLAGLVDPWLKWAVGTGTLRLRPTDLARLAREAAASSVDLSHQRVLVRGEPAVIRADGRHLQVAISNVIRNALQYSPGDSQVRVVVERGGDLATVSVRDRGPGVPTTERDAIFDPFVRGATGVGTRTGSGLGLFIARRIVEAHQGAIRVESHDQGANFLLELPLAQSRGRVASAS